MEVIKQTMNVSDALGWYMLKTEKRTWTEEITDDETGDVSIAERSEPICGRGTQINEIIQSLLIENGAKQIEVSNVPILGEQSKYLNLWETTLNVRYKNGNKPCKNSYYLTADHPAAAEAFIVGYFELNIDANFEFVKVSKIEYNKVIRMYETERDEYEESGEKKVKWYKCQIYSMVDDDGESRNAGMKNILVQAVSFESAITAVKSIMNRDEYDAIYNTIKLMQELSVIEVFIPDESVSYYSNDEI